MSHTRSYRPFPLSSYHPSLFTDNGCGLRDGLVVRPCRFGFGLPALGLRVGLPFEQFRSGFVNQFAALLLAPVGIADGLLLHSNSNKPRLRKLGIGLFVLGAVLDIISLVGLQQGFAGFALSNNAPFFLTSAVLSASTRSPTIHVGANRTAPTNQGYKPIPVTQSPPLPQRLLNSTSGA